jgi:hypothetical protein
MASDGIPFVFSILFLATEVYELCIKLLNDHYHLTSVCVCGAMD